MKKILCLLFLLSGFSNARACLNYYFSIDMEGHLHPVDNVLAPFNKNFDKEKAVLNLQKLEGRLKKDHSYGALSDYSLGLLKLGKYKEGLEILIDIYRHYPNDYKIAANLGTAYELNGKNDSALKYIKRGLKLNPKDHEGSEWVHVKVLETKQALAKDPSHLNKKTVLQLSNNQKREIVNRKQIEIQVRERFPFTPGPDKIMANILTDLGDCYANTTSIEYAEKIYTIAREYYGDKSPALDKKIKEMKSLISKYDSIRPKNEKGSRSTNVKVTGSSHKYYIKDNDPNKYVVNWSAINTNVKSLVALVEFKK